MSNGWDESADAWIAALGEGGDWARQNVLDPALLERVVQRRYRRAVDVGCGEGRMCRMLQARAIQTVGIDPTAALLERARPRLWKPSPERFRNFRKRRTSTQLTQSQWSRF